MGHFEVYAIQQAVRLGNFVLTAERSGSRRTAAHQAARTHDAFGRHKAKVVTAHGSRKAHRSLQGIYDKVTGKQRLEPACNLFVGSHVIFKATRYTFALERARVRFGTGTHQREHRLADVFALHSIDRGNRGIVASNDHGIHQVTEGGLHLSGIFGSGFDTFRQEPAHQVRLMLHEPAACVGALVGNAL